MVSAINYEPQGIPLKVCGHMNAQTSRFHQLEVTSDLSSHCALPGQFCINCVGARLYSALSIHAWTYDRASRGARASASGFNNDSLIFL